MEDVLGAKLLALSTVGSYLTNSTLSSPTFSIMLLSSGKIMNRVTDSDIAHMFSGCKYRKAKGSSTNSF